jgi:hypothetical protein
MSDTDLISRLTSAESCEKFARNVEKNQPELAKAARRRALEFEAAKHEVSSSVEREAYTAVYAYERVLSAKKGKKIRASRTWQMIERHGIVEAIERAVNRPDDALGYQALAENGPAGFGI